MPKVYISIIVVLVIVLTGFYIIDGYDNMVIDIPPLNKEVTNNGYFEDLIDLTVITDEVAEAIKNREYKEQDTIGVTVIIHGFDVGLNISSVWAEDLQEAIMKRNGEKSQAAVVKVEQSAGQLLAKLELTEALSYEGEIVIRLDWSEVANHMVSYVTTQEVAEVVAPLLYQPIIDGAPAITDFSLHIIAHSRGASMAYELARLLDEQAITVEQLTSLDPHPLTEADVQPLIRDKIIDAEIEMQYNIVFADNYWQDMTYPKGQHIAGAYNRLWTELENGTSSLAGGYHNVFLNFEHSFANHLNLILMYQGTIDFDTPISSGLARMTSQERDLWYNANEQRGAMTGYYFKKQR